MTPEKPAVPPGCGRTFRIPRAARYINTAIAIVLCGLSAYHFTQPNQAWRSGTFELVCAALLLTAAYLVSNAKAMAINLVVALGVAGLGVRHLIYGGGWRSGTTEELFAVLLVAVAIRIYRDKRNPK